MLRGAMIGVGTWGERQLQAWQSVPDAQIVALCDRDPALLAAARDRFNVEATFDDAAAMLDAVSVDFVDICTRPSGHAALVRLAADRGLPVLCQKPFCSDYAEAQATVAYCEAAGVPLMVNENFRWQSWYRAVADLLATGVIGMPFLARIHWRMRMSLPAFHHPQVYFKDMPRLAVYELGVHYIDVFRFLFGEPNTVYARLHRVSPHIAGEDVQIILLAYEAANLTCMVEHSWASVPVSGIDRPDGPYENWEIAHPLEIDGTDGTIVLAADRTLSVYRDDGVTTHQTFPQEARFASQVSTLAHFIDCLVSNLPFETNGRSNLQTMAVAYACYESAASNRVIRLEMSP